MHLFLENILGFTFLFVALLSVTSYDDAWAGPRLKFFYRELKPMQQRWGQVPGTVLHVFTYVITPMCFGILFLLGYVI